MSKRKKVYHYHTGLYSHEELGNKFTQLECCDDVVIPSLLYDCHCVDNCPTCIDACNVSGGKNCIDNCPNCEVLFCDRIAVTNDCDNQHIVHSHNYDTRSNKAGTVTGEHDIVTDNYYCVAGLASSRASLEGKMNPYKQYVPVDFVPDLDHFPEFIPNHHSIGGLP